MATDSPSLFHDEIEHCDDCGRETQHSVSVEILAESGDEENAAFSREPYRVTKCRNCGNKRSRRMNNA